jgi:hypothetical protein
MTEKEYITPEEMIPQEQENQTRPKNIINEIGVLGLMHTLKAALPRVIF